MDIGRAVGRYMGFIVLAGALLAFFVPGTADWIETKWINYMLGVVMFGMGLTIRPSDFKVVFTDPRDVLIGCLAQFSIMPVAAYLLCVAFDLEKGLMAGVMLVGACPGGTASNVITYFAKGDVPLSVGMTAVNTLLAPIVTPFIVYLALSESIDVDTLGMFLSMVKVVVLPLTLGFVITYFLPRTMEKASGALPFVSLTAIVAIVMCIVSHSVEPLKDCGITIFAVVILHNLIGYAAGYTVARLAGMPEVKRNTLSIEVGMQNSGLASSLATTSFPSLSLATVPGAVFSVWHNLSGAVLAGIFARKAEKAEVTEPQDISIKNSKGHGQ